MSNLNLTSLPLEVIEKIFKNLNFEDIKNVILVCQQFEEIVANSNELMKKIKLKWSSKENYDIIVNSKRRYRAIKVKCIEEMSPTLCKFLQRSSSLTEVTLFECELKSSELQFIMECVGKTIITLILRIIIKSDVQITPVEFSKLENLEIIRDNEGDDFIDIFYGAKNIKKFEYVDDRYYINLDQILSISRYLASMESLKILSLCGGISRCAFSDELLIAKFQLECLKIKSYFLPFNDVVKNNFVKFIDTQQSSLKELHLKCMEITSQTLQSILKMQSLSHLEFLKVNLTAADEGNEFNFQKNYSIQYINFFINNIDQSEDKIICDFIMKCTGLRKLDYESKSISFDMLCILAYQMENLENIQLQLDYSFAALNMANIKEMTLLYYDDDDIIEMIRLNPQLKKLKLRNYLQYNQEDLVNIIAEMNVKTEFVK